MPGAPDRPYPGPVSAPDHSACELACSRLVAWGNAYLRGATSLDEAAAAVSPTWVLGLPDNVTATASAGGTAPPGRRADVEAPAAMTVALGRLRHSGVTRLRLALPAPGDPLGLTGPPALTAAAIDAGAAVLTLDGPRLGLLLAPGSEPALWRAQRAAEAVADVPLLPEAERSLAEALREATDTLVALDVARADHRAAAAMAAAERAAVLAPGHPGRAHRVLAQAARLRALVAVALSGDGGALSSGEVAARTEALRPLERAARRACVAAHEAV